MLRKLALPILQLFLTIFIVTTIVFFLLRVIPGDPARVALGMNASEESVRQFRTDFGLDRPVLTQYLDWLGSVLRFDYGVSFRTKLPVTPLISERLGLTLFLALGGMLLSLFISIPAAAASAMKPWRGGDRSMMALAHLFMAFPEFWIGMLLILLFSVALGWFPLFGSGFGPHLILPVLALGLSRAPVLYRTLRNGLILESRQPYTLLFLGAGISKRRLIWRYLLPNQLPGLVAIASIQFGYLLGGAIIIEQVFALPGLGRLLLGALLARDLPLIQGGVMVAALIFSTLGLFSDWANRKAMKRHDDGRRGAADA